MKYRNYSDYEIHPNGDVVSLKFGKMKLLKQHINVEGYHRIGITNDDGVRKFFGVHRLVGECFIPNPLNLPEINHKDCNKSNNNVENLEWCNHQHNIRHSVFNKLYQMNKGIENHNAKMSESDVYYLLKIGRTTKIRDLEKMFPVSRSTINKILNNKLWKHLPR
jgi:hypothetical protein